MNIPTKLIDTMVSEFRAIGYECTALSSDESHSGMVGAEKTIQNISLRFTKAQEDKTT